MVKQFSHYCCWLLLIAMMLLFAHCKKDHGILDAGTQPSNDGLNTEQVNDITVLAHTILGDTVASFNSDAKFLGYNNDPVFGITDVGLCANTSMNVSNFNAQYTYSLSSAEIILAIDSTSFIGDITSVLTCSVFSLSQQLDPDVTYYTGYNKYHNSTPITIAAASYTRAANKRLILRIPIDQTYATQLIQDTSNLKSNDTYQAKYKGYYIACSVSGGGEGVIYKINTADNLSGFFLYYRDGTNSSTDSVFQFRFPFTGSNAVRINSVKYAPSQDIQNQMQDSSLGANRLFLKGLGNTNVKLQIPFLKNMSDSFNISVNRAELVVYVDPTANSGIGFYQQPPVLALFSMDSLSKERFTEDHMNATAFSRYGGTFDSENKRYVFNISREVQAILAGEKKNRGFYLVVAQSAVGLREVYATSASKLLLPIRRDTYIQRVVLAGSNNASLKPRLNLSLVKLRNEIK